MLEPTTHSLWLDLEDQFVGNHETHAMILDTKFGTFVQGDLSIFEYYRHLKGMADGLGDMRKVVLDRTLILTILRGLNGCFSHMVALLKWQWPFPTFIAVRNDLQLEEIKLASKMRSSMMALVASIAEAGRVPPATPSVPSPICAPAPSNPLAKKNNYRKNNSKQGGSNQQQCFFTAPMVTNLWLRSLQLYSTPRPGGYGLLGPQPGVPPQHPPQVLLAQQAPATMF
jgi:hypothetical protein